MIYNGKLHNLYDRPEELEEMKMLCRSSFDLTNPAYDVEASELKLSYIVNAGIIQ